MKSKKLFLPVIILLLSIVAMAGYAVVASIAKKPTVTNGEFPITITYEYKGETKTIKDTFVCKYIGNGGYADTLERHYEGYFNGIEDKDSTCYTISKSSKGDILLNTNMSADYMMGDPQYEESDYEFEPQILCYNSAGEEFTDEETLAKRKVKLISWEYSEPINNSLEFSHISNMSGAVVIPTVLIAVLALVVCAIFVKKEENLQYTTLDKISFAANIVIGVTVVPFITLAECLMDITGGSTNFFYQMNYFLPAIAVLCIAASICLRRKGYKLFGLLSQFFALVLYMLNIVVIEITTYI